MRPCLAFEDEEDTEVEIEPIPEPPPRRARRPTSPYVHPPTRLVLALP